MLFREIIAVYCENRMKPIMHSGQNAELLNVETGDTYSNHCTLKGQSKLESKFVS
jgi:hypothetical protein